jgi:hypothetical protein
MGYYPTPELITDILRARVVFPEKNPFAVLDPCCGEGLALDRFTSGSSAVRYGIEPDNGRFESAVRCLDHVLHSPIEDCRVANKAFSLIWLNPPYDWEHLEEDSGKKCERKEVLFLKRCMPWIAPGGILIYIIPETIWTDQLRKLLAYKFDNLEVWRFPDPDYSQFQQIVIVGRRKEKDYPDPPPTIGEIEDFLHTSHVVPASNPEVKLFQSTRVSQEEIERLVPHSPCWKNFLDKARGWDNGGTAQRRPPLPLHAGHLALMLAAGVLDGVMGSNGDSHVVKGKVRKNARTSVSEEINPDTGGTVTTSRQLDEYRVTIKVLERDGTIRELT